MTAKAISQLTDKQLETEWTKKAKELDRLKKELKEFSQEHQARATQKRAEQLTESLTDNERKALIQAMTAAAIESEESVHNG